MVRRWLCGVASRRCTEQVVLQKRFHSPREAMGGFQLDWYKTSDTRHSGSALPQPVPCLCDISRGQWQPTGCYPSHNWRFALESLALFVRCRHGWRGGSFADRSQESRTVDLQRNARGVVRVEPLDAGTRGLPRNSQKCHQE